MNKNEVRKHERWRLWALAAVCWAPALAEAESFPLPAGADLIGEIRYTQARHEDTLIDIAREFSIGQDEIVMANSKVDRWMPKQGTQVLVPHEFILPDAPRAGIVVNIPEMRLYYYPVQYKSKAAARKAKSAGKGKSAGKAVATAPASLEPVGRASQVITYPISIGRMDWRTPLGTTRVVQKVKDPVWIPPETIKKEHAAQGEILPAVVPAGPNNPLGQFAMKLGVPGYLIHGTDVGKSYGIGMRVTHGCIRMYPEDVARLFPVVSVGTPVHLVNQPVKLGWKDDALYMEVSQPLDEDRISYGELYGKAMALIGRKTANHPVALDETALKDALEHPDGVPVQISRAPEPYQAVPGTILPDPTASVSDLPANPAPAATGTSYAEPAWPTDGGANAAPTTPAESASPDQNLPAPESAQEEQAQDRGATDGADSGSPAPPYSADSGAAGAGYRDPPPASPEPEEQKDPYLDDGPEDR